MLVIQAHCHAGVIKIAAAGIPMDAKVVVLFLSPDENQINLTEDQQAILAMQSQSNFAQTVLLNPEEDCWNNV